MKKLFAAIIITFIVFVLVGCDTQPEPLQEPMVENKRVSQKADDSKNKVMVYYTKDNFLIPAAVHSKAKDNVKVILESLFEKEPPLGLTNKLCGVELRDYEINGRVLTIDVSEDFLNGSEVDMRRAQLVHTLFEFGDISQLVLTVEGKPRETVTESPKYSNITEMNKAGNYDDYLTVYYADSSKTYIVPVTIKSDRIVQKKRENNQELDTEDKAEMALLHILEGPQDIDNLAGIFPEDIKLRKFWIDDGVAYMDVDIQLLLGLVNQKQYEKIAVESIVQTLTEIDGIKKVQFLISGKPWTSISGHVNISNPIERYRWYNDIDN